jgi:hypothetical protein
LRALIVQKVEIANILRALSFSAKSKILIKNLLINVTTIVNLPHMAKAKSICKDWPPNAEFFFHTQTIFV